MLKDNLTPKESMDLAHFLREKEREERMKKIVSNLTDELNSSGFNQDHFDFAMNREHPYLQVQFLRMLLKWLEFTQTGWYNHMSRENEAIPIFARAMLKGLKDEGLWG